ncbi:MAG: c-type cytochrome [Chitinophagaceae bacterium]
MRKLQALLLATVGAISFTCIFSCNETKTSTEPQAAEKPNEDSIKKVVARGEYLAMHVTGCMDCHSKHDWTKYSGPMVPGTEGQGGEKFDQKLVGVPGVVYARNITPDPETGIGKWSDAEIIRAMTQGISKNGDTLFPLMPYPHINRLAKEDILSIVAYLHTLKPIKNEVPKRQLMLPAMSLAYPPNLQPSIDSNAIPPASNIVAYGAYLTNAAACMDCHTPMIKGQFDFQHAFSGGLTFNAETFTVSSANITPDSATGLGTWTEERFLNKFIPYRKEESYNHEAGKQNTIMPLTFYAGMTDEDLKAIYAFLRTLPPTKHAVEKYPK